MKLPRDLGGLDFVKALGRYIEWNPVQAGITPNPEDWSHSSAAHTLLGTPDPLVDPYEKGGIPEGLDLTDGTLFTRGTGIGSEERWGQGFTFYISK